MCVCVWRSIVLAFLGADSAESLATSRAPDPPLAGPRGSASAELSVLFPKEKRVLVERTECPFVFSEEKKEMLRHVSRCMRCAPAQLNGHRMHRALRPCASQDATPFDLH